MLKLTAQEAIQMALQLHKAGNLRDAEEIYKTILQQEPGNADILHLLGIVAYQDGNCAAAAEFFRRAISINFSTAEYHNNLGNALKGLGRLDETQAAFRKSISLKPDLAEAHFNLGALLQDTGRTEEAIACNQRTIELNPNYINAHNNLGNLLRDSGKWDESIVSFHRAIALDPEMAIAHYNLSIALALKGQLDDAITSVKAALALQPDFALAHHHLGNVLKDAGRLDGAIVAYRKAMALTPNDPTVHSNLIYTLYYHPDYDAAAILQETRRWCKQHAVSLNQLSGPSHPNDRTQDRPLRIGYVSPDFRDHVVGRNMLPMLRAQDRDQFNIYCYSDVHRPDGITQRLQGCADVWRNIAGLGDDQVARLIRQDKIDILVDLALHMAGNRLLVFARKPAPVQATFAGYPGTTGLDTMDYRLTDPHIDPPSDPVGNNDACYSEQSVRLPDSFWLYDPLSDPPPANALPALAAGTVTFGCLNNFCKVNEPVLKLWAQVLRKVKGSRLLLLAKHGGHREWVVKLLEHEGIEPRRVEFMDYKPRDEYLLGYHRIDIGLDTFPYNGHTTSLDSYWMGVPVVTLVGRSAVGRAGWSQLCNLGLKELAAQSEAQFVQIAVDLANDLPRLSHLRSTLCKRMQQSPLMDAPRFARNIEAAYRKMWQHWCAQ